MSLLRGSMHPEDLYNGCRGTGWAGPISGHAGDTKERAPDTTGASYWLKQRSQAGFASSVAPLRLVL